MSVDNIHIAGRSSIGMPTNRATQPFRWLVKRELWEHSAVRLVPLAAAADIVIAMLLNVPHAYSEGVPMLSGMQPEVQRAMLGAIFMGIAHVVWIAAVLAAMFFCLDALHAERRDRSILFWKSMPVSDLKTVLAKFTVPLAVIPMVALVVIVGLEVLVALNVAIIALVSGRSATALLSAAPLLPAAVIMIYALVVMTLWLAPIYAWLLLVSAWARRMALLWATLPPLAVCLVEKIAFDTTRLWDLISERFLLSGTQAFTADFSAPLFDMSLRPGEFSMTGTFHYDVYSRLTPLEFLSTPALWVGLVCAAACIVGALFVRRQRDVL